MNPVKKKYPLCDMLNKYPTMVDAVMMEFDKMITFQEGQTSITTADTKIDLNFAQLLRDKEKFPKEQETDFFNGNH